MPTRHLPLPADWSLALASLAGLALLAAALSANWKAITMAPWRLHLLFGAALLLGSLRLASFRLGASPEVHLLGIAVASLTLGPRFALLVATAVEIVWLVVSGVPWLEASAASALEVLLPVAIIWTLFSLLLRHGPRNHFAFTLLGGFAGGASTMAAVCLGESALIRAQGGQAMSVEVVALLSYAEGFVSGALLAVLAVYFPHWLKAYDDRHFEPPRSKPP